MAANYNVLTDLAGKPLPQIEDPYSGLPEVVQGAGNASTVIRGRWWQVGAGATTTTIPMQSQNGYALALSASKQSQLVGSLFECLLGTTLCQAIVTAVSSTGTLTLDSALPSAPAQGAQFLLTPTEQTSLAGSNVTDVVFQNAVSASGNGTPRSVKGYKTLVVEVFGASSPAGTVSFQAAGTSGVFAAITGTNLNGLTNATSTSAISTTPVQWQFDIEGLDQFQCPVTWTAGTITVQGRLQA